MPVDSAVPPALSETVGAGVWSVGCGNPDLCALRSPRVFARGAVHRVRTTSFLGVDWSGEVRSSPKAALAGRPNAVALPRGATVGSGRDGRRLPRRGHQARAFGSAESAGAAFGR